MRNKNEMRNRILSATDNSISRKIALCLFD